MCSPFMYFMSPITPQLREKLQNEDTTIEEVLNDDSCTRAYEQAVESIVDFFWHRAEELLNLSLSTENRDLSTKAFVIITMPSAEIWQTLVSSDLLMRKSETILVPTASTISISRFAAIAQHCCMCTPQLVPEKCPFLKQMIRFVHFRSVYDMFLAFFNNDAKSSVIREVLRDWNFVSEIFNALREAPSSPPEIRNTYTAALLKLLSRVKEAELFDQAFASEDAIRALLSDFPDPTVLVLDAQWQIISNVIIPENAAPVRAILPNLVKMLAPHDGRFSCYQISILEVIEKFITFDDAADTGKTLLDAGLPDALATIVKDLGTHTLATRRVSLLCLSLLKSKASALASVVLPRVAEIASEYVMSEDVSLEERAFGWNLFTELKASEIPLSEELTQIITEDLQTRIDDMNRIADEEFGGALPTMSGFADEPMMSQELLALLRLLSQARG